MSMRLAMWSGPRNISTAMMRAWGNRPDTVVCDEPLYAHYLKITGLPHPGAAEVIVHHETDWRKVVAWLTGPVPDGRAIFYQKHMTHHLLPGIERRWLDDLTHAFLIRDPREMLTSYIRTIPDPRLEDTGLPQQVEIFDRVKQRMGRTPPVIDARDVLENPRRTLGLLCDALLSGMRMDNLFSTHPATENRIAALRAFANEIGGSGYRASPTPRAGAPRGPWGGASRPRGPWG